MKFPQVWQVWSSTDVKLRTEGLPGIHQRFIPKKRSVCSRERTKRFLCFFHFKWCRRNATFKITYHHCSADLMRFWNLLIDREGLVNSMKTLWKLGENLVKFQNLLQTWRTPWWISKTWGKPGEFPKLGENLVHVQNLVNFQNLVKGRVNFPKLGEHLVISKTWWRPGEFPQPGENLVNVKTWGKPGEFARFSPNKRKKRFLRIEGFW